jgi:hypothetical protein
MMPAEARRMGRSVDNILAIDFLIKIRMANGKYCKLVQTGCVKVVQRRNEG